MILIYVTENDLNDLHSLVWLINGLYCKLLGLVPRHGEIVARILGETHAVVMTRVIGILEILMAIWIWSRIKPRVCAITQAIVIAVMNIIEFTLAPDLLLFCLVKSGTGCEKESGEQVIETRT